MQNNKTQTQIERQLVFFASQLTVGMDIFEKALELVFDDYDHNNKLLINEDSRAVEIAILFERAFAQFDPDVSGKVN